MGAVFVFKNSGRLLRMSSEVTIRAVNLSKEYRIYSSPQKRLLEIFSGGRKQLHKRFNALHKITFDISAGTTVGIVGRNGSGKSTLLQILAGTLTPTIGSVEIRGRITALLELGSGFNPEFSGRENVYLYGSIMQMTRAEINDRIDEILSFADIGSFIDQPIKTYSSGMHVRLAFSAAIHIDPDVLLIDEALAVGDPAFQLKCFEKLNTFRTNGKTIVLVTHNINAVSQFCDRVFVLSGGELVFDGKPLDAINIYKSLLFANGGNQRVANEMISPGGAPHTPVILNKNEHRYRTGAAEVFHVELRNRNDQPHQVFLSNEETTAVIKIRADRAIKEPVYGIIIKNKQGLQVYVKNTLHERLSCPGLDKGAIQEIHFKQKLHLAANDYFLTVGIAEVQHGELIQLDRRSDVLQFKIIGTEPVGIVNLNSVIELK
jgi:ABC-type polysaccharide/polyol phosphate transport system ATPase subunit